MIWASQLVNLASWLVIRSSADAVRYLQLVCDDSAVGSCMRDDDVLKSIAGQVIGSTHCICLQEAICGKS